MGQLHLRRGDPQRAYPRLRAACAAFPGIGFLHVRYYGLRTISIRRPTDMKLKMMCAALMAATLTAGPACALTVNMNFSNEALGCCPGEDFNGNLAVQLDVECPIDDPIPPRPISSGIS